MGSAAFLPSINPSLAGRLQLSCVLESRGPIRASQRPTPRECIALSAARHIFTLRFFSVSTPPWPACVRRLTPRQCGNKVNELVYCGKSSQSSCLDGLSAPQLETCYKVFSSNDRQHWTGSSYLISATRDHGKLMQLEFRHDT